MEASDGGEIRCIMGTIGQPKGGLRGVYKNFTYSLMVVYMKTCSVKMHVSDFTCDCK